jgi:hypothetical protein
MSMGPGAKGRLISGGHGVRMLELYFKIRALGQSYTPKDGVRGAKEMRERAVSISENMGTQAREPLGLALVFPRSFQVLLVSIR